MHEAPPKLLSFSEFHVDASLASLWNRAPVISAVRLVDPSIHLVREADGRLSIADLAGQAAPAKARFNFRRRRVAAVTVPKKRSVSGRRKTLPSVKCYALISQQFPHAVGKRPQFVETAGDSLRVASV